MSIAYEDTLFADWFRKNRMILLGGLIAIVAIQGWFNYAPKLQQASMDRSWNLYSSLVSEGGATGLENLNDRLARSRQDERIHPWFVFAMVNLALQDNDQEALRLLDGELDELDTEIPWQTPAGKQPLAAFLSSQVDSRLAGEAPTLANPPATGELVEISLKDDEENTYTVLATLYPEAAPETCDAFLAAIEAGSFQEGPVNVAGQAYLTIPGLGDPEADPVPTLPLERKFGYMLTEGALVSSPVPSMVEDLEPGAQSGATFQLLMSASHFLDGRRTVFGQVTEGLEPLQAAVQAGPAMKLTLTGIQRKAG